MTKEEFCEIMNNSNFMIDSNNEYDMKILEILEKNVPKQPTKLKYIGGKLIGVYCPTCGLELVTTARPCYCGQKILPYYWSED